jgi:rod shape-determining protein MreD
LCHEKSGTFYLQHLSYEWQTNVLTKQTTQIAAFSMKLLNTILVFAAAFLVVFGEVVFPGPRHLLGAQIDLLPALMIYAALNTNITVVSVLAIFGGLCFDSLSENPLGLSIVPLLAVGFPVFLQRELILRELPFAQFILGGIASAIVPLIAMLLLLSAGKQPLIGWGSLWQWVVMTAGGALATPIFFALFNWCDHAFGYQPRTETSFRPDREILRGRRKN